MKKSIILLILLIGSKTIFSQPWLETVKNPNPNFYELQQAFYDYWKDKDIRVKGGGYKQFKRWEYFMEPRVYPSGDITLPSRTWEFYEEYLKNNPSGGHKNSQINSTTWMPMGPFGALSGFANNNTPRKAGRYNFITFHPSASGTYWCGSPSGGLWKTTNNGTTWNTNTDNLGVIGCTDLAIDPSNTNIMYLATGDGYAFPTYYTKSIGVLKSTDGGASWSPTGLTFAVSAGTVMRRLIIDPSNTQKLIAATNVGIYVSTNAAASWSLANGSNVYDLEFNAANTTTVYAAGPNFSISTNGGASFSSVGTVPNSGRMAIAVTTANPNYVYAVCSTGSGTLIGVYRSINGGTSFSLMSNTLNILGPECTNTISPVGQGWFCLGAAASPTNANELTVGSMNVWQSLNGGATWNIIGCRDGTGNPPYIHADHHDIEYSPNGGLYSANDGGICQYNGSQWPDLTGNANIAHIYKIGLSSLSPNLWITGHQDNGTNIYNNGTYAASFWSDGMDCFIDRTNDQNMFGELPNGDFIYTTDGGQAWNTCTVLAGPQSGWVTPWKQDPQVPTTVYAGRSQMKKSTIINPPIWNAPMGTMAPVTATQNIVEFAIAPSNNQIIYAIHGTSGVFTSTNGGTTWAQTNTGLPGGVAKTFITVHPTNPQMAWVTCSGYLAASKVYTTNNGAASWGPVTNAGLPNLPVNCSVYELGNPNNRIYIGMDVGVYYIDNTLGAWQPYNTGLPNVVISDLEISPASPNKLRAATFGRGVYQVDLVPSAAAPVTAFNYIGNKCAVTSTLYMNDNSSNSPSSWSWSVNPSTGVTINNAAAQNPTITFANFGTYSISMIPTNGFGPGPISTQTVSIFSPTVNVTANNTVICIGQSVTLNASGAVNYTWQPNNIVGSNANYTPAITVNYTATGIAANGCTSFDTLTVFVSPCTGVLSVGNKNFNFNVYPNPTKDNLSILLGADEGIDVYVQIFDIIGKEILSNHYNTLKDNKEISISTTNLPKGTYILRISIKEGASKTIKIFKE